MDANAARADVAEVMTSVDQVPARGSVWRSVAARGVDRTRVEAREQHVEENCSAWWCVINVTAALNGAWGRVQSPMAARLPRVCRSA